MADLKKKKKQKKLNYYEAFCKQIDLAIKEAELLSEITENFTSAAELESYIPKAHEIENKADDVCREVYDAILTDFVTPIDREDILSLTNCIDELTNAIEDVIRIFYMYDVHFMHEAAGRFADITMQSCKGLQAAFVDFHGFKKDHKKMQKYLEKVIALEDEADALYMEVVRSLYTEEQDNPMRVMVWSQIFAVMEDCVDCCEDIAEQMNSIMLKHG